MGDKVEADVINSVFSGKKPPVSANKSLIGHAMGASSAIESIFAMEGMKRSAVPPTINYTRDEEANVPSLVLEPMELQQDFVLKNSFGFGGCNTCIVFQRLS